MKPADMKMTDQISEIPYENGKNENDRPKKVGKKGRPANGRPELSSTNTRYFNKAIILIVIINCIT